jgi:hypothetical protein
LSEPKLSLFNSPSCDKVVCLSRVALGQGWRRPADNRLQLGKDVGERLGRVGVASLGELDDRQSDGPDVG